MSFPQFLDDLFHGLSDWAGHVGSLTDLQTVTDDQTFVLKNGDLMTLVEVHGTMSMMGSSELQRSVQGMHGGLHPSFERAGHTMGVYYSHDPDDDRSVRHCFDQLRGSAKTIHLDMDDVLDDWQSAVSRYVIGESVFVSLVTRADSLDKITMRDHKRAVKKNAGMAHGANAPRDAQNIQKTTGFLMDGHTSFVEAFLTVLKGPQCNLSASIVPVHRALWEMRHAMYPDATGESWRAWLPGDPLRVLYDPDGRPRLFYPGLGDQLFAGPMDHADETTLKIGDRFYRGLLVDKPPLKPTNFNELYSRLSGKFPWRIAFHVDADGLSLLGWRDLFASAFAFTSSDNRRFVAAKRALVQMSEQMSEPIVRFRCSAVVSGRSVDEVHTSASKLHAELQRWGTMDAQVPYGLGQQLCLAATIPGLVSKNPGTPSAAPLQDVVLMMPFVRPAHIWDSGLPLRTMDGHLSPYQEGTSKQTSFVEVGIGPMGTGKSVNANSTNLAFLLSPGQPEMPYLSIVDVGGSSSGVPRMVRDALPEHMKHMAVYIKLSMNEEYSINLCDTWLMARHPLSLHETFLVNFLSLIGMSINDKNPEDGLPDMARRCIHMAYDKFSDQGENKPKLYKPDFLRGHEDALHVDRMIVETGMHLNNEPGKETTWWEVVNHFFHLKLFHEATIAQRFAMPTLRDVIVMSREQSVIEAYGQDLADKFYRRCSDALEAYPIIRGYTRFSLGDARVVSIDLNEVATKGSATADRQTAVMFMMTRQLLVGRFFITEEDALRVDEKLGARDYFMARYRALSLSHKRLFFDELHRVSQNSTVAEQIISDITTTVREARKWNIHLAFYSQDPKDIPDIIRGLATVTFIFGVNGNIRTAEIAADLYDLGESSISPMVRFGKPNRSGSSILAKYVVGDGGSAVWVLKNTLGPVVLWALSSTREDAILCNALYAIMGSKPTRAILAKLYPGGSVKDDFEKMATAISTNMPVDPKYEGAYQEALRHDAEEGRVNPLDVIRRFVIQRAALE